MKYDFYRVPVVLKRMRELVGELKMVVDLDEYIEELKNEVERDIEWSSLEDSENFWGRIIELEKNGNIKEILALLFTSISRNENLKKLSESVEEE